MTGCIVVQNNSTRIKSNVPDVVNGQWELLYLNIVKSTS